MHAHCDQNSVERVVAVGMYRVAGWDGRRVSRPLDRPIDAAARSRRLR